MYLNKAIICGNVVRAPELRQLAATGTPVASFAVATNRVWTDGDGAQQQAAEFHNVVVYGKQAEPSAHYLKKGQLVLVEGRLQTRSWDGQDGQKCSRTEIVAERVQFGPRRQEEAAIDEPDHEQADDAPAQPAADQDDEIPF
jgi:single-strand DNA-binding protein